MRIIVLLLALVACNNTITVTPPAGMSTHAEVSTGLTEPRASLVIEPARVGFVVLVPTPFYAPNPCHMAERPL